MARGAGKEVSAMMLQGDSRVAVRPWEVGPGPGSGGWEGFLV